MVDSSFLTYTNFRTTWNRKNYVLSGFTLSILLCFKKIDVSLYVLMIVLNNVL